MKLELNDRAIEKIKIADFEFTYINDNKTKSRDRIHIPFKVAKKSTLKGLNLIVHKSTSRKNFCLKYWFKGKSKVLTLGKFVPGIYGIKQVEEELFPIVQDHTNKKGHWIKDPTITERNKTRIITDTQFKNSQKKTLNEIIIACCKANLPKGKRAGTLRADSAQDLSRYMLGYNWRHKHLVFRDDKDGNGYITFKANWHKRAARPESWEDLFTRYGPGALFRAQLAFVTGYWHTEN